jgi:hypothetical protein
MCFHRFFLTCLVSSLSACGAIVGFDMSNTGGASMTTGASSGGAGGTGGMGGDANANGGANYGGVTAGGSTGITTDAGMLDGGDGAACAPGTWILLDEVQNARGLGGIALEDGAQVSCGALYRGSAPVGLGDQGCTDFGRLGIRTVIDLRTEAERLASPDDDCVRQQVSMVLAPMPTPFALSPANYVADLYTTTSIVAAFEALGDKAAYPIYFHCVYGRDRTGVLAAVILLALGASREEAMTDYQLSVAGGVGAYPASLQAVLDDIDQVGGVEAFLATAGVSTAALAALRASAIAR